MLLELDASYEPNFLILGLSCFERDYRLCWLINNHLGMSFARQEDLCLSRKGVEQCFPLFSYYLDSEDTELTLIKNRVPKGVLLPELKQMDYLLKVDCDELPVTLADSLRSVPRVQAVFVLDSEKLKERDALLF